MKKLLEYVYFLNEIRMDKGSLKYDLLEIPAEFILSYLVKSDKVLDTYPELESYKSEMEENITLLSEMQLGNSDAVVISKKFIRLFDMFEKKVYGYDCAMSTTHMEKFIGVKFMYGHKFTFYSNLHIEPLTNMANKTKDDEKEEYLNYIRRNSSDYGICLGIDVWRDTDTHDSTHLVTEFFKYLNMDNIVKTIPANKIFLFKVFENKNFNDSFKICLENEDIDENLNPVIHDLLDEYVYLNKTRIPFNERVAILKAFNKGKHNFNKDIGTANKYGIL